MYPDIGGFDVLGPLTTFELHRKLGVRNSSRSHGSRAAYVRTVYNFHLRAA